MYFVVFNYTVIIIFVWVAGEYFDNIQDLSDKCVDNKVINTHLTTGIESSDYFIGLIANEKELNCSLLFTVSNKNFVMVNIEFIDWMPGKKICSRDENIVNVVSHKKIVDVCKLVREKSIYSHRELEQDSLGVKIVSVSDLNTLKIVATGMKYSKYFQCNSPAEIKCIHNDTVYCMISEVQCDGHANCGVYDQYDEDKNICQGPMLTPLTIFFSMVMAGITFLLVVSVTVVWIPKRKEIFIYKFDQTMSLFDTKGNFESFEINVQIVFPEPDVLEGKAFWEKLGKTSERLSLVSIESSVDSKPQLNF